MAAHQPFEVTAHLRTGVSMDPPYGLDLAGLLAARVRTRDRAHLAATGSPALLGDTTGEEAEDLTLPLARCTIDPRQWHWLATCAIALSPAEHPEPRTFYRVVDSSWAQHAATRPLAYHHPRKGPYRDMMLPSPVLVTATLVWRAVGDPEEVEHLLRGIRFLGRRRATGEGRVLDWSVTTLSGLDEDDAAAWVHHDGEHLLRPIPHACAEHYALDHRTGYYALRPPSWHPDRLTTLAMTPEPDDDWIV